MGDYRGITKTNHTWPNACRTSGTLGHIRFLPWHRAVSDQQRFRLFDPHLADGSSFFDIAACPKNILILDLHTTFRALHTGVRMFLANFDLLKLFVWK